MALAFVVKYLVIVGKSGMTRMDYDGNARIHMVCSHDRHGYAACTMYNVYL